MISESHQYEEPPQFYGGIIADPMGLGKTLTMIALVATDLEKQKQEAAEGTGPDDYEEPYAGATLIVVPPPRKSQNSITARLLLILSSYRLVGRAILRVSLFVLMKGS